MDSVFTAPCMNGLTTTVVAGTSVPETVHVSNEVADSRAEAS
ncbi:hypothetical protein WME77_19170 [Sorangium sp. So ce764]